MHEVALAERMVRIALEAAEGHGHGHGRVTSARLLLGALGGADAETLRFAFDIAARGTRAEGCRLDVVTVPTSLRCRACGAIHVATDGGFLHPCPACQAIGFEVLHGREMQLESIDVDDVDDVDGVDEMNDVDGLEIEERPTP